MNHLYTAKRAVYLAYVASHLKRKRDLFTDIKYVLLDSNPLRPCLQLKRKDCRLLKTDFLCIVFRWRLSSPYSSRYTRRRVEIGEIVAKQE